MGISNEDYALKCVNSQLPWGHENDNQLSSNYIRISCYSLGNQAIKQSVYISINHNYGKNQQTSTILSNRGVLQLPSVHH